MVRWSGLLVARTRVARRKRGDRRKRSLPVAPLRYATRATSCPGQPKTKKPSHLRATAFSFSGIEETYALAGVEEVDGPFWVAAVLVPRRVNILEKSGAFVVLLLSVLDFPTKTTPSSMARRLL
jgi:hypothetical protein